MTGADEPQEVDAREVSADTPGSPNATSVTIIPGFGAQVHGMTRHQTSNSLLETSSEADDKQRLESVRRLNWLGIGEAQLRAHSPSEGAEEHASERTRTRRMASRKARDKSDSMIEKAVQAGSVVRFNDDGDNARVGLVIREPTDGKATVRLQGSSRTMEVPVGHLERFPDLPGLGVSRGCLRSFREQHAELLEDLSAGEAWSRLLLPMARSLGSSIAA